MSSSTSTGGVRRRRLVLPALAVATGLAVAGTAVVSPGQAASVGAAHDRSAAHGPAAAHGHRAAAAGAPGGAPTFFTAKLKGGNEVPPADRDGSGTTVVRIQGTRVCFTTNWSGVGTPTAAHIHLGAAGVNGPVKVLFFGAAVPGTVSAVTGCVDADAATVAAIEADPAGHYVNVHNAEFPGGAIRGQLRAAGPVDLLGFLRGSLVAVADGGQEIPPGDPDGHGTGFVRGRGSEVRFALIWNHIGQPTLSHIHAGGVGVNGPVVVTFFTAPAGIPAGISGVAGTATGVDPKVVKAVNSRPHRHYVNLHNTEFPAGAVRGQLFRAS